ncbi:SDR family oxidoreductase [soil metagenome]
MRIVIAGGHGKIALLLSRQLADAGHQPVGLIRSEAQAADLEAAGAASIVLDLEKATVEQVAAVLAGANAAVFSAGSGGGNAQRTLAVDRDGAILFADAALSAGVRRFVLVSAMSTDTFDAASDDGFQLYLRAKSEADAYVRGTDLDWTIVRPGALTDEPGRGTVALGTTVDRGSIPRADVASVVAVLLETGSAVREQFEVVSGVEPIAQVL